MANAFIENHYEFPRILNLKNVALLARAEGYDTARIFPPTRQGKKLSYLTPDGRLVNFGNVAYESYDSHMDRQRRAKYLARARAIKGAWQNDPYSPNNLAIHILWSDKVDLR
jgi:hypothetical protein